MADLNPLLGTIPEGLDRRWWGYAKTPGFFEKPSVFVSGRDEEGDAAGGQGEGIGGQGVGVGFEGAEDEVLHDDGGINRLIAHETTPGKKPFVLRLTSHTRLGLVMFDLDGIMETAFPPTDPGQYLSDSWFQYLGSIEDFVL